MGIEILYQDNHVIAVAKPSGQVTIPGRGALPGDPLNLEVERTIGQKVFVVHRLDRGASGIVLLAKDAQTHRHLSLQFEGRQTKKSYRVLVQGCLDTEGTIDRPLRAFGSGRMGIHPQGKPSQTTFSIAERLKGATLLDVHPLTGRRHQIRVHLYSIGHPVMGDMLYGKDRPVGDCARLMLHASALDVVGADGNVLRIQCSLPADFKQALALARQSAG